MEEWDRGTPWRQGHVFTDRAASELGLVEGSALADLAVVVVSHDCDLVQGTDKEPDIEVIVGRRIAKPDGNFTHSKNPRRLHLSFVENGTPIYVELHATGKRTLPKESVASHTPNASIDLTSKNRSVLQEWLAARYRRTAFPEEFERRLRDVHLHERIPDIIGPHGEHLVAILLDLHDGQRVERPAGDLYTVSIYVLYYTGQDPQAAEKAAREVARAISEEFRRCCLDPTEGWKNIELLNCEAISDMTMPFALATQLARLNLDYLSLRAED